MTTSTPSTVGDANPPQQQAPPYVPLISNGTLPPSKANVAVHLQATPEAEQVKQANDLYLFLTDTTSNLLTINMDTSPRTVLLNLPKLPKVKVLFCGRVGTSGIGHTLLIDNQFVWLTRDREMELGMPTALTLPLSITEAKQVSCMTQETLEQKLQEKGGASYLWPLIAVRNVQEKEDMIQVAPIPIFLVFNSFNDNLDAAEVLKRFILSPHKSEEALKHAAAFLRSCLALHNTTDNKPHIHQDILMAPPSADARRWATQDFRGFPELTAAQPQQHQPPAAQDLQQLLNPLIQAQLHRLHLFQNATSVQQGIQCQEEKKDDKEVTLGISEQELHSLLEMCGELPTSSPALLPEWFHS